MALENRFPAVVPGPHRGFLWPHGEALAALARRALRGLVSWSGLAVVIVMRVLAGFARRWARVGVTGPARWVEVLHLIRIGEIDIYAVRPWRKR